MQRIMMKSKIHRATVTHADLNYVGSLTVDRNLMEAANLLEGEQICVVDIDNGARVETYVIPGGRGSGVVGVNGAAAHLIHPGDLVILIAYGLMSEKEVVEYLPRVIFVNENNECIDVGSDPSRAPAGSRLKSLTDSPRG